MATAPKGILINGYAANLLYQDLVFNTTCIQCRADGSAERPPMVHTAAEWRGRILQHLSRRVPGQVLKDLEDILNDLTELEEQCDYWRDLVYKCEANHPQE